MKESKRLIELLKLTPHPEGGYFREVYRSDIIVEQKCLPDRYDGNRNSSTSIYFLLEEDQSSKLHRIKSDEIWHHYKGAVIIIHLIHPDGKYEKVYLGDDLESNQVPQFTIPAGSWFAAELLDKTSYCLIGCTVSPGFDFADFELADRDKLINEFPQHLNLIRKLT